MPDGISQPQPHCFFCDGAVTWKEGMITDHGRIYGSCCADLVRVRERAVGTRVAP